MKQKKSFFETPTGRPHMKRKMRDEELEELKIQTEKKDQELFEFFQEIFE